MINVQQLWGGGELTTPNNNTAGVIFTRIFASLPHRWQINILMLFAIWQTQYIDILAAIIANEQKSQMVLISSTENEPWILAGNSYINKGEKALLSCIARLHAWGPRFNPWHIQLNYCKQQSWERPI